MKRLSKILIKTLVAGFVLATTSLCSSTDLRTTNLPLPYYQNKKIVENYLDYQNSKKDSSKLYTKIKHKIFKGDTFSKIARLYATSTDNVQASNLDKEAEMLEIGGYLEFNVENESLRGYLPPSSDDNIEKNREYSQNLSPEKFKEMRERKGFEFIANMNGITLGKAERNKENVKNNLEKLKPLLEKCSENYSNINLENILGIGYVESGFSVFTSSNTGSLGIFGNTLPTYGYDYQNNPFNILEHVNQSCKKYSDLKKIFDGSEKLAIFSFNAGEKYARKAIRNLVKKNKINGKYITRAVKELKKKNVGINEILEEIRNTNWTKNQRERILEGFEYYDRVQNAKRILKKEYETSFSKAHIINVLVR